MLKGTWGRVLPSPKRKVLIDALAAVTAAHRQAQIELRHKTERRVQDARYQIEGMKRTIIRHRGIVHEAINLLRPLLDPIIKSTAPLSVSGDIRNALLNLQRVFPQPRPALEDMDFADIESRALAHSGQSREGFRHYGSATGRWRGGGGLKPNYPWLGSAYDDFMVVERARRSRLADEHRFVNQEIGG